MYSTGLRVTQQDQVAADGMRAHTRWFDPAAAGDPMATGQQLHRAHCQPCHTMDGYNGLRRYLAHWNEETILSLLPRLEHLRGGMPPWYGTEEENTALAAHLLAEGRLGRASWPSNLRAAGRQAWDLSCGLCHTTDGYRPLRDSVAELSREELNDLLDMAGDLTDEMPAYHGDERQREYLLAYLGELAGTADPTVAERRTP
jgi:mono/diheme cytochrome c family protein